MAKKLLIVMANTDPRNGEELGAPIFQASVAAAMDYEVEVICTATAGRLMKKGEAEKVQEATLKGVSKRGAAYPAVIVTSAEKGDGMPELRAEIMRTTGVTL